MQDNLPINLDDAISQKDQQIRELQDKLHLVETHLVKERIRQNYFLKWLVPGVSLVVVILLFGYLIIFAWRLWCIPLSSLLEADPIFLVSLVVAPIASLTVLLAIAISGVFRVTTSSVPGSAALDVADAAIGN